MNRDLMLTYQIKNLMEKTQKGFDTVANGLEQLENEVNKVKQVIDYRTDYYGDPSCVIEDMRSEIHWIYNALDQLAHVQQNQLAKKRHKVTICAYGKTIEVSRR